MNKYPQNGNRQNGQNDKGREKFVRVNWKIKNRMCRIVADGRPPVIMPTKDAIDYAQGMGLDLVEIGYDRQTGQSICKVLEYGKYIYEQKQREKQAKKQARANQIDLKCVQMSLTTDTADLNRMIERAKEFLNDGDRVKFSIRFRGRREMGCVDLGRKTMSDVLKNFEGLAVVESAPALNGRELSCVMRSVSGRKQ